MVKQNDYHSMLDGLHKMDRVRMVKSSVVTNIVYISVVYWHPSKVCQIFLTLWLCARIQRIGATNDLRCMASTNIAFQSELFTERLYYTPFLQGWFMFRCITFASGVCREHHLMFDRKKCTKLLGSSWDIWRASKPTQTHWTTCVSRNKLRTTYTKFIWNGCPWCALSVNRATPRSESNHIYRYIICVQFYA